MDVLKQLLANNAVWVSILSWFIAQLIKVITVIIRDKKVDFTRFIGNGGMPSSHTAFIISLAVVIGKIDGFNSTQFAIALAIALIVMVDAAGIRRAAGMQAKVLNELIFSTDHKVKSDVQLKELLGHSPLEVFMGALLGILIGAILG
jgi:acid phosphatase family membrane protein YuiD